MSRWESERVRCDGSEKGLVLIMALFMLVTLIGVVLVGAYPLAHEKRNDVKHHSTLARFKDMERGAFGRLADQRGGKFNACGGYFSDTGLKVRREADAGEAGRMLEYWCFKKELYGSNKKICKDNYRYDKDRGFWVGYRGKRYIVSFPGEEHLRDKVYELRGARYTHPILVDGYKDPIDYKGYSQWAVHYSEPYDETTRKEGHPTRQYNPVDKLEVTINARRPTGTLSTELIYAKQPDYEKSYEVVTERGVPEGPYTFVFEWENPDPVCPGHSFQMGLKKLVIYEDDIPRLTQAICIPAVKKFRSMEEIYKNVYRVEVDYE